MAREEIEGVAARMRPARPEPAHGAVRPADPAVQGLRLDGDAALQLALFVLPEPCDGPGERLDERDLSAMGRRARRDDRDAGVLVPGAQRAEAHDRLAGLRGWRQSRSDDDPRKNPEKAKALELSGWSFPRHLAGRLFAIVVHGDAEGAETLRRSLNDWLTDMELVPAAASAVLDRYVGYYEPYATSHEALDRDTAFQQEVRNAARTLCESVKLARAGKLPQPDRGLRDPRPK